MNSYIIYKTKPVKDKGHARKIAVVTKTGANIVVGVEVTIVAFGCEGFTPPQGYWRAWPDDIEITPRQYQQMRRLATTR